MHVGKDKILLYRRFYGCHYVIFVKFYTYNFLNNWMLNVW
jgi:hypothetical protein